MYGILEVDITYQVRSVSIGIFGVTISPVPVASVCQTDNEKKRKAFVIRHTAEGSGVLSDTIGKP